ncbi:MAG: FKBP-type peptidyl-prolyl cis-trans isomerase N-terminal domain-containing protein [Alistipes sp.]
MKKILLSAAIACAVLLVACGGDKGNIRMGSLSDDFDSLSYVIGANVSNGINNEMKDIPFDFDRMTTGLTESAFEKSSIDNDRAMEMLRDYFMTKRGVRAQALDTQRAAADSVRLAAGDSTKMEYPADPSMFESDVERDSISYAFGVNIGYNLRTSGMPINLAWLLEGMKNVREGNAKMDENAVNEYLQYYFMVKRPAENKAASEEWLKKIEKKSGVKKTESGLLYKITKKGDADTIAKNDNDIVKVQYKGMTREGKVFDASRFADKPAEAQKYLKQYDPENYAKDEPVEFPLNGVIAAWTEGMKLVGKGGKITLWAPAELAYGERGAGRDIGPNEALCFEVEVIDVVPYVAPLAAPVADSTAVVEPAAAVVK